jgi:hypothetical protein
MNAYQKKNCSHLLSKKKKKGYSYLYRFGEWMILNINQYKLIFLLLNGHYFTFCSLFHSCFCTWKHAIRIINVLKSLEIMQIWIWKNARRSFRSTSPNCWFHVCGQSEFGGAKKLIQVPSFNSLFSFLTITKKYWHLHWSQYI